jgi:hypothetical protein
LLAAKDEKNLKKKKLGESTAIYCAWDEFTRWNIPATNLPPNSFYGEHFFKFSARLFFILWCFVKPLKHLEDRYNKRKMKK